MNNENDGFLVKLINNQEQLKQKENSIDSPNLIR